MQCPELEMKFLISIALAIAIVTAVPLDERATQPQGIDVSDFQPTVNWATVKANGLSFVFIKATEGTSKIIRNIVAPHSWHYHSSAYTSPAFSSQYTGATNAGFIRGAYHFAHPDSSSGAVQAKYFLANGGKLIWMIRRKSTHSILKGGWSGDGKAILRKAFQLQTDYVVRYYPPWRSGYWMYFILSTQSL